MLTQTAAYLWADAHGVYNVRSASAYSCRYRKLGVLTGNLQDFGGVVFTEEEGDRIGDSLGAYDRDINVRCCP